MGALGNRIKTRRTDLGWTQDVLAEKAGISKSFLSDIENGKRNISAETLLDVARVLGLSLDYVMKGEPDTSPEDEVEIPSSLAKFALQEHLSFTVTLTLLEMQRQIIARRSATKSHGPESVDWRKFYESVKDFL